MNIQIKTFSELSNRQLYEILRLRSAVFVVEQGGIYQDPDGIDYDSTHVFFEAEDGQVLACLRLFPKPDEPGTLQLGRIVSRDRLHGTGKKLMEIAFQVAKDRYHAHSLYLTGRASALGFYERCGFTSVQAVKIDGKVAYHCLRRNL